MLLDADATAYGTIFTTTDWWTGSDVPASVYAEFEYKIPENADGALTTTNIISGNQASIEIPAGTYDWCIPNPTPGESGGMWIAAKGSGNIDGRADNFVFEAGKIYEFYVHKNHNTSFEAIDLTITSNSESYEPIIVEGVTSPYTIEGLDPATTYQYEVIGIVMGSEDASSGLGEFTTLDSNPVPFDVVVKPAENSATISWTGYSDGYVVRYREANVVAEDVSFYEDFESGFDAQGWTLIKAGEAPNSTGFVCQVDVSENLGNGTNVATSYSWTSEEGAYNADNWLISPLVDLEGTLRYWEVAGWSEEYTVLLSTTGKNISDFTTTLRPKTAAPSSWNPVEIDLSTYEGQKGYIAFHHVFYNGMRLNLDNVCIYKATTGSGEWQSVSTSDTKITINGLTTNTDYEFVIVGTKNGESVETGINYFTTQTPISLALDNNADNTSVLSANDGVFASVTIQNLTLESGKWQGICLPFDVDVENSVLAGADVRTLESETSLPGYLFLNFFTPVTEMKAGTPYLVKWNNGYDLIDPTFENVTIDVNTYYVYVGGNTVFYNALYYLFTISEDLTQYFAQSGSTGTTLIPITTGYELKAFEPYFYIDDPESYDEIYLNTGEYNDMITGLSSVEGTREEVIYNLSGQRLSKKQRGINIVNGKKVLIK
jgi:hypothetical protein